MKNNLTFLFFLCFLFISTHSISAQNEESDDEQVIVFDEDESEDGDDPEWEYYYDWDMPRYSLGINLNSAISPIPMAVLTHDFGLDDYRRIAIETGVTLYTSQQQGFKLRGTYQKFFTKNDNWGAFYGVGLNLVSFWEPRTDQIFLENTYQRLLHDIRNQSYLSGVGEIGMSFEFKESQLLEFTMGLGGGVHRAGGTFVVVEQFDRFQGFLNRDPGYYFTVPFYLNMSYSVPLSRFKVVYN